MEGLAVVLALAALPAGGNLLGAFLAELVPLSQRALSIALHLAAGVVFAVVGLELMPAALEATPPWVPIVGFVVGGAVFLGLDRLLGFVQALTGAPERASGPMGIFGGVCLDLFSDGVMIGTATIVDPALGLLLALGQVPADLPEGFAAIASLRAAGVPRGRRVLLSTGFAVAILAGALLGYLVLQDAPAVVTLTVLAVTGGALATVVVEELVPEAHEGETSQLGAIAFTAGFALLAAISVYS